MSRLLFYLSWPLIWLYAPISRRVRIVILHKDTIVLVKNIFGPGAWQLPGGGIKFGESVEAAGMREAEEELGLKLTRVKKLHEEFVVVRQFGLMMRYSYVCVELDTKHELQPSNELSDAEWVNLDEMPKVAPEVIEGLRLAGKQG